MANSVPVIERAQPEDADAVANVLRESIALLCTADHGGDPVKIDKWTRNKTPAMAARWIADPVGTCLVSRVGAAGVAAVGGWVDGAVLLLYVAPAHQGLGHGGCLLARMESDMLAAGVDVARLTSTRTALGFYRARGWLVTGAEDAPFGMPATPMAKRLG